MYYRHTQWGVLVLLVGLVFGGLALFGVARLAAASGALSVFPATVLVVAIALMAVFSTLTVEVTGTQLRLWFGLRVIQRTFPISEITGAAVVRNSWWYGWGIRLTPHGWLFNVSGFDAVEIAMQSGKRYRIGTDEPHELLNAIEGARHQPGES